MPNENNNLEQTVVNDGADRVVEDEKAQPKEQKQSLDEFLSEPKNQSAFDKRVAKAIETARAKWEEEAKLSAEELAEKQLSDREKAIAEREAAHEKREFTADIREELLKNQLPVAFAEVIANGSSRETVSEVLAAIKAEWDKQITEQIKAGARQKEPLASASVDTSTDFLKEMREFAQKNRKVN